MSQCIHQGTFERNMDVTEKDTGGQKHRSERERSAGATLVALKIEMRAPHQGTLVAFTH